jgi:hypothetical protein
MAITMTMTMEMELRMPKLVMPEPVKGRARVPTRVEVTTYVFEMEKDTWLVCLAAWVLVLIAR